MGTPNTENRRIMMNNNTELLRLAKDLLNLIKELAKQEESEDDKIYLLTVEEAAEMIVGISKYQIRKMINNGRLPCVRVGHNIYISSSVPSVSSTISCRTPAAIISMSSVMEDSIFATSSGCRKCGCSSDRQRHCRNEGCCAFPCTVFSNNLFLQ